MFFFKQKTAYEMRISDWSSDVCSSDLPNPDPFAIDVLQCRSETDCTLKVLNLTRKIHIVSRFSIAITKIAIIEGQRSYPCCAQNGRNRRDIRPFFQTALTVRHDDDRMRAIAFRQLQNTSEGMRSLAKFDIPMNRVHTALLSVIFSVKSVIQIGRA